LKLNSITLLRFRYSIIEKRMLSPFDKQLIKSVFQEGFYFFSYHI